jgi:hypothetical protein
VTCAQEPNQGSVPDLSTNTATNAAGSASSQTTGGSGSSGNPTLSGGSTATSIVTSGDGVRIHGGVSIGGASAGVTVSRW